MKNIRQSSFINEAEQRMTDKKWLKYSSNIARRILAAIEDKEGFNQTNLAELIGVTPQHISQIVKGKENVSLKTIAKLSEALGVELISFPPYKYSAPTQPMPEYYIISTNANEYEYSNQQSDNKFHVKEGILSTEEIKATANSYSN